MKLTTAQKNERKADAIKRLRKILKPGGTITFVASGFNRRIGGCKEVYVLAVVKKQIKSLGADVSDALDLHWNDNDSIRHNSTYSLFSSLCETLYGNDKSLQYKSM